MQSSSKGQYPSFVATIARWWRNLWGNRAGMAELRDCSPDELRRLASDVGVNTRDLRSLAGKWPDAADLLTRRMATLQLNPLEIERSLPAVSNDLKKLCSFCVSKGQCMHDLADGATNADWQEYCPNTTTLIALSAERDAQATKGKGGK